ncbi:nuclear pore complex-interacting protein family member B3-like [Sapajus apella]|uniref:Nuclear pore complex-interacting protein family member B3-like n=1 Tax=Sapajus apella TaxID=9515 RepID=A0A6J3F7F6_SAPAP|nr:nuclear pore complex-interacting protein family member B3-like [Sapajus apella]
MAQAGHGSVAPCDLYPPCQGKTPLLTPQFPSHDQGQLAKELQQHIKSVTTPCNYLRKVSEHRQMGPGALVQFLALGCPTSIGWPCWGKLRQSQYWPFPFFSLPSEWIRDGVKKEQLLSLRFLTLSSPHPNQRLRSTCRHTKKRVLLFPGIKMDLEDLFMEIYGSQSVSYSTKGDDEGRQSL